MDETVDDDDLAVSMEADDPRLQEEEKKSSEPTSIESDDDSDDIDADLDALEQSV